MELICEPCTFSPELVEDCLPTSSSDTGQLSLLSVTNTPVEFCDNEPQTDGSQACQCGKGMSDCLIHPSTPAAWIASMQDSLANLLALPDFAKVLKMNEENSSLRSFAVLKQFDPNMSFSKMSQDCSPANPHLAYVAGLIDGEGCLRIHRQSKKTTSTFTAIVQMNMLNQKGPTAQTAAEGWYETSPDMFGTWSRYSGRWPRWGMTAGGFAYAHPMSERRITETGGLPYVPDGKSFHHPPNTSGMDGGSNSRRALKKRQEMWPTPSATDGQRGGVMTPNMTGQRLTQMVNTDARKMFPTPTNHNHKESGAPSQMNRNTVQLGDMVGGQLNPTWVAWLMGFPIGWASLKDTETPKSLCKPQQHGNYLEANK